LRSIGPDDLPPVLADATASDGRHILLDDPAGNHQLWFKGDVARHGATFLIPFDDDVGLRLHAVQRLTRRLTGQPAGPLLRSMQLTPIQRTRLTLQLRALDGEHEGASRREIAAVLIDARAHDIRAVEWTNAALRKRINRIIAGAKTLMNGGYLALLRGDVERARRFQRSS
jgi:hypothetical protein